MSWTSWASLLFPTLLIAHTVLAWSFTQPNSTRVKFLVPVVALVLCVVVAPVLSGDASTSVYASSLKTLAALCLDLLGANHANMLLTGAAVVWLVRRGWQTLWKPVPELINILGVDVPDPPDVSLAGIRSDAATVNWTRYPANRPVEKFLIQVNGVVVGEVASNQESAIVVSGLKPNHFYNVRVIAVGHNNFQAGSRVIRLRTFAHDGRPELGNARMPSNFQTDDHHHGPSGGDHGDEHGGSRSSIPVLENASTPEAMPSPARDGSSAGGPGPRRNTVTRRHSPSTTSLDQLPIRDDAHGALEKSLPELTEKFEAIRRETEETAVLIAREDNENRRLLDDLEAEKLEKRREQKKKEEQTEKLKREVNATDRTMRDTMQRRAQKEKLVKEKGKERAKYQDNIGKWDKDMDKMRVEQQNFEQQKKDLEQDRVDKAACFQESNTSLLRDCSQLEAELKDKRDQVRELEDERKRLPGGEDDAEWAEKDAEFRKEWHRRQRQLQETLLNEQRAYRRNEEQIRILNLQINHIPAAANYGLYSQPDNSGLDFDNATISQLKRRSRTSNSLSNVSLSSPLPAYSQIDPNLSAPTGFGSTRAVNAPPGFAPGPYMDLSTDMPPRLDEAGIRASIAPLSPSATALLPSSILDDIDDDEPSPTSRFDPDSFNPPAIGPPEDDPQSPASSGRSLSILSSPHGSSHNLPFPPFANEVPEGRIMNGPMSPESHESSTHKLGSLFSFQRSRAAKVADESGPALGSLKHGQSQSFPRQTDENEVMANKRRISLSGTWNMFNRNSAGPDLMEGHAVSSRVFSARNLNPFSHSHRAASGIFSARDPSSPRPASIASTDFPRPSTDSSSIWGPPPPSDSTSLQQSRIWSPEVAGAWSRNPSRRPSLHGSPSALKTTLASADDEILDEETLPSASEVGIIGSRPPGSSNKALARLNPNAPAFIGSLFSKSKSDKDREREKESGKEKDKKSKDKSKDKTKDSKDKPKGKEPTATTPDTLNAPSIEVESPPDSRKSRDAFSINTQPSVSESRESLTLDISFSNTTSDSTSTGMGHNARDENVVRKLFRKGSSGKFSLPGRLGGKDSSLFKKGPGSNASAAASDRGLGISSLERTSIGDFEEIGDETGSLAGGLRNYDSVTSSPSIGATSAKGTKDPKTPVRWLSNFSKKGKKEKESLDLDREAADSGLAETV